MSNPTTPFSWQMPTATDLVTDLPADFEVFGQAVATSMADLLGGTTGQVLSKASNADMDFTFVTPTSGMTNPMTTTGDIIYSSSGSTPARLGIGSAGQVLNVAAGIPAWTTPSGSKVVQIVNVIYSTEIFSSSSTFADTGLTATITPTSASNKVLILLSQNGMQKRNSNTGINLRLLKGASVIRNPGVQDGESDSSLRNQFGSVSMSYLDSPATTSATTYKTTFNSYQNSNGVYVQFASSESSMTLLEVTP